MTNRNPLPKKLFSILLTLMLVMPLLTTGMTANASYSGQKPINPQMTRNVYYAYGMSNSEMAAIDCDAFNVTHICYAFIGVTTNGRLSTVKAKDSSGNNYMVEPSGSALYNIDSSTASKLQTLVALKQQYPWVKILISVAGGSDFQEANFRTYLENYGDNTTAFEDSCVAMCNDFNLDGVDLDWEHPDTKEESRLYANICAHLRSRFGPKGTGKCVSIAFPVSENHVKKVIIDDIGTLIDSLDFWNLMTYDLGSSKQYSFVAPWEHKVGSSSVYGFTSVHDALQYYHDPKTYFGLSGNIPTIPYEDLNIGFPFYGKYYYKDLTIGVADDVPFGSSFPAIKDGDDRNVHSEDFRDIEGFIGASGWTKKVNNVAKCPYLIHKNSSGEIDKIVTYDDVESLSYKIGEAQALGVGGMMTWSYRGDTYTPNTYAPFKNLLASAINPSVKSGEITPVVTGPDDDNVLTESFDNPNISATSGDSTPGAWSAGNDSSGAATATLTSNINEYASSLRVKATDGLSNYYAWCGYAGASENSRVKCKIWLGEGATTTSVTLRAGSTDIGTFALTPNTWNEIETDKFGAGTATSGKIRFKFVSSPVTSGQSAYIDNFVIYDDLADGAILYQTNDTAPVVSDTKGDTTHGTWSNDVSGSTGPHISSYEQYTTSSGLSKLMKFNVGNGRYTIDTYCGYQGAQADSVLTFKVWVDDDSTVTRIDYIKVGNTEILGQTALVPGQWNTITTSAFGAGNESGTVKLQFYSNVGAVDQCYYIDDFRISAGTANVPATGITLYKNGSAVANGGSTTVDGSASAINFTAAVTPADATNQNYTITVSNSSVASVSGNTATVTPANASADTSVTITATSADGGYTASYTVNIDVQEAPQPNIDAYIFKMGRTNAYWATYDYPFAVEVPCQFVDGATYVPFRVIAQAAGAKSVTYDQNAATVTLVNNSDMTFILNIGSTNCTVIAGGQTMESTINSAPQFIDGAVCLPVRDVANVTFSSVEYVDQGGDGYVIVSASKLSADDTAAAIEAYEAKF